MPSISGCDGSIEPRVQTVPTPRSTFHGAAGRCIFGTFGLPLPMAGRPQTLSHTLQIPDRKSTRLNSSHLGISYAVFFLKKKTVRSGVISYPDLQDHYDVTNLSIVWA